MGRTSPYIPRGAGRVFWLRGLLWFLWPLCVCSCGSGANGGTVIIVTLTGVDSNTRTLRATSYLDGRRELFPVEESGVTQFGIRLPAGSTGTYRVDIDALGDDRCSFAAGRGEQAIGDQSVVELTVPVRPLDVPTCGLTVGTLGAGQGWVESVPAGIRCGSQYDTCFAQFQQGAPVNLRANPEIRASFDGWSMGCAGTGGCQVVLNTPITVSAAFGAMPNQSLTGMLNRSPADGFYRPIPE